MQARLRGERVLHVRQSAVPGARVQEDLGDGRQERKHRQAVRPPGVQFVPSDGSRGRATGAADFGALLAVAACERRPIPEVSSRQRSTLPLA